MSISDNLHQLAVAVAGGLSPFTFLSREARAPLPPWLLRPCLQSSFRSSQLLYQQIFLNNCLWCPCMYGVWLLVPSVDAMIPTHGCLIWLTSFTLSYPLNYPSTKQTYLSQIMGWVTTKVVCMVGREVRPLYPFRQLCAPL